jgi:HD-GYP domain-containing protein (c-di-GMP phosphodiesterase class II)
VKVEVSSLRPGVSFSKPVYIEDDNLLVPAGIAVRKRDIQHLTSWGIYTVETEGQMIPPRLEKVSAAAPVNANLAGSGTPALAVPPKPAAGTTPIAVPASVAVPVSAAAPAPVAGTAALAQPVAAATRTVTTAPATPNRSAVPASLPLGQPAEPPAEPQKKTISAADLKEAGEDRGAYYGYLDLIDRLQLIFDRIESKGDLENHEIDEITDRLLREVREQKGQIVGCILGSEITGRELAKSSVNIAIMAARTAIALRLPPHKLMHVITASLLHDTGMLRVPSGILQKQGSLTEDEAKIMQSHVAASYRIMCKEFSYPEEVGRIAGQHHERWDGQGYPRNLAGAQIDAGARIVAVADAFEAMVREKPYRNSLVGYEAMRNLVADYSRRFDPDVVKAFVRTMGIYPIGSLVKLNTNAIARVMEVKAAAPLTPVVQILIDEHERVLDPGAGKVIDLLQGKEFFIARALDPRILRSGAAPQAS